MLSYIITLADVLVDILLIATVFKLWNDTTILKTKLKNVSSNLDMIEEITTLKKKVKSLQKTKYIKNKK